jgi:hypothetical protein
MSSADTTPHSLQSRFSKFHTSEDFVRSTIWQLLSRSKKRVGLFGWPMTWPQAPIDGFDVPCHHARDGRTWPPAFDRNVLGVRPDLKVEIRLDVLDGEDGPMLRHGLQGFHGAGIAVPRAELLRPRKELLDRIP